MIRLEHVTKAYKGDVVALRDVSADIQKGVPEVFPSKHEISAHAGFQAGFGAKYGSTSGFKLEGDYAYKYRFGAVPRRVRRLVVRR